MTEGEKAIVESICAELISNKGLVTKEVCKLKEEFVEKKMKSIDRKQWAIIVLLVSILGSSVAKILGVV
jgi:hypothetical protein